MEQFTQPKLSVAFGLTMTQPQSLLCSGYPVYRLRGKAVVGQFIISLPSRLFFSRQLPIRANAQG
jgi:hypothetical protein